MIVEEFNVNTDGRAAERALRAQSLNHLVGKREERRRHVEEAKFWDTSAAGNLLAEELRQLYDLKE